MKAMIISFVCVLTFATQSLSAQNLTLEVRGFDPAYQSIHVKKEEAACRFCCRGEG